MQDLAKKAKVPLKHQVDENQGKTKKNKKKSNAQETKLLQEDHQKMVLHIQKTPHLPSVFMHTSTTIIIHR